MAPAGLVLVQVTHHGPAEEAGLREAVPPLKEGLHDVGDEAWRNTAKAGSSPDLPRNAFGSRIHDVCMCGLTVLNGWDGVCLLVAQRTNLQVKLPLQVTCQEKKKKSYHLSTFVYK